VKLAAQSVCAALAVEGAGALSRLPLPAPLDLAVGPAAGWALSFAWVVGVTNIYNFLDGIDGFAGLQGVAACGALAAMQVSPAVTPLLAAAAGGCAGFLIWNWHPAKIFMGDVGSTTLGFLIATAPLHAAEQERPQAVLAAGLALWFFLSDGVYTLARRAARGEKFWQPHRTHLYQLLAGAGWRHDRVAARVGGAGVALAGLAAAAYRTGSAGLMWGACLLAAAGFAVYWKRAGAHGGAPGIGGGEPCKP
jgi:UDP-N-acetylmuramyl pentapeptide phosphotransferase/UDP-N-acetylglucosamine-1-phosphate transferase